MRKRWWAAGAAVALAVTAGAVAANNLNFGTHLNGRYELPIRDTDAQGQASFRVAGDGQSIQYKLIASNIENAMMAHIHLIQPPCDDPETLTGGIVVWLYPSTAPTPGASGSGRHSGVLAEGTINAADLVGPLAGDSIADLLAAIAKNCAYVNVHTDDGVLPANTGPGDFVSGEIRGNLEN